MWVGTRVQIDSAVYYVGRLRQLGVPAYTRAEARVDVRLTQQLTATVTGQNLFRETHAEFTSANIGVFSTLVPRSVQFQLRWQR